MRKRIKRITTEKIQFRSKIKSKLNKYQQSKYDNKRHKNEIKRGNH